MARSTEVKRESGFGEGARYVETRGVERCVGQGLRAKYVLLLREIWKNGGEGLAHGLAGP